jgi:mannose-1-phosphate guanylyltransferase
MRYGMIMAGGSGTRLWPISRASRPKQLVPLIQRDDRLLSLLEIAAMRFGSAVPPERRLICTNERFRPFIREHMPDFADDQIIGEPVGRDTVNAVGLTAAILYHSDPSAIFAVLTADQIIEPADSFTKLLDLAYSLVEQDPSRLVTFSIKPTHPATGFGYVERADPIDNTDNLAFTVERFVEKPDEPTANKYLASGRFGWNSGMFVWSAATLLDCIRRYEPVCYDGLTEIASAWGTPDYATKLEAIFPTLPKISVDYAVMEPAAHEQQHGDSKTTLCTILADVSWLDVGSWPSLAETLTPDSAEIRTTGPVITHDSTNCLAFSDNPNHTITLLGCDNLVVVHTPDATLVMPADKAQDLKSLHEKLPDDMK